jgi:hypothetical protein
MFSLESGFMPISGSIEHSGTLSFDLDTYPVDNAKVVSLELGDFSIGFDADRVSEAASGFFVADTVSVNAPLFDISNPKILTVEGSELLINDADLLVSPELAAVLGNEALVGADVGDARIDADLSGSSAAFTIESGLTSVALDTELLSAAANLDLIRTDNVESPVNDHFQVGFKITEATDFTFGLEDGFMPISGSIEHSGTLSFELDGYPIVSEVPTLELGNFSIGFDADRVSETASGFFVADTVSVDAPLFDISNPEILTVEEDELVIDVADLLVSPELAAVLGNDALVGADVGDARIDAKLSGSSSALTVESGVTSVSLDTNLLSEAANLDLIGTDSVVAPANDHFQVGFAITDATNFMFSLEGGFMPISGSIEHSGTLSFELSTTSVTDNCYEPIANYSAGSSCNFLNSVSLPKSVADASDCLPCGYTYLDICY